MMVTNRPHSRRRWTKIMHLLRYPGHAATTNVRNLKISRADNLDTKAPQQSNGCRVECITRRNPDARANAFPPEDFHTPPELLSLLRGRETGELARFPPGDQPSMPANITMLESVECDRPTAVLPRAHAVPKISGWSVHLQDGIAVVGNHSENPLKTSMN